MAGTKIPYPSEPPAKRLPVKPPPPKSPVGGWHTPSAPDVHPSDEVIKQATELLQSKLEGEEKIEAPNARPDVASQPLDVGAVAMSLTGAYLAPEVSHTTKEQVAIDMWLKRYPQYVKRLKECTEEDEDGFHQVSNMDELKGMAAAWMTTIGESVDSESMIATLLDEMNEDFYKQSIEKHKREAEEA